MWCLILLGILFIFLSVEWLLLCSSFCFSIWIIRLLPFLFQVYATSMAMLLTMVLSVILFNFKPTVQVKMQRAVRNLHCFVICLYYVIISFFVVFIIFLICLFAALFGYHYLHDVLTYVFCSSKHTSRFAFDSKTGFWECIWSSCWKKKQIPDVQYTATSFFPLICAKIFTSLRLS